MLMANDYTGCPRGNVYRRILGPVYDNEKVNWRILTNKESFAIV